MNPIETTLRDVTRQAIIAEAFKDESPYNADLPRNLSIVDTDTGLAVCINSTIYAIDIAKV